MEFCRQSNDYDHDGFDDNCEYRIAHRFAPLLATNPSDLVSRETHWVAKYRDQLTFSSEPGLEVAYLLSYHFDLGDGGLQGHSGDSEFIVLQLRFDQVSAHWMVWFAYFAAHHNTGAESDRTSLYTKLEYPDVFRGYPRIWVANKKHGSYITKSFCNSGGVLGADDCSHNYDDERISILRARNLGSREFQLMNCTYSENPLSFPGVECFWDFGYKFCGWDLDRSNCASPYATILSEFSF